MEPFGGDRVVTAIHDALQLRKPQLVPLPRTNDQRLQPPFLIRCEIGIVKRPCVVPTESRTALGNQHLAAGSVGENPMRDQAVRETAADEEEFRPQGVPVGSSTPSARAVANSGPHL